MKKSIILAVLTCMISSVSLFAQNAGDMYISGSIGMSGSNTKAVINNISTKTPGGFQMSITPQFGIFVIENLEVHLGLGYQFSKTPSDVSINESTNTGLFVIAPGINYYLPIVDGKFYYTPGLDIGVGFGSSNYKTETTTNRLANNTTFALSLALVSFEFRPVEHFGISFRAGDLTYGLEQMKQPQSGSSGSGLNLDTKYITNNIDFGLNLNATIGFRYYF